MVNKKEKQTNYWQEWLRILNVNLLKTTNYFGADIDDFGIRTVRAIASNMIMSFPESNAEIYADTIKRKHFHMIFSLKKPYPYYLTLASRFLAYDDVGRIRSDLVRLACNQLEFVDYLADEKMDISHDILTPISSYKKTEVI